ncbi:multiple myeloma tumor-associated protein 2 homolog isoform X2 [Halichondria panicea]|uniref:multiple myeloma tumor-associated protein 2 homolog isoform X2 n=1 Tax=Halichondria panicea TaxID=6063 RepID=UPI00312BB6A8
MCYLGHSMMAPVGRWQKGKDLTWYTKKSKTKDFNAILEAERAAVKRAEEEAMTTALGFKPAVKPQQPLSKQEVAVVFRRQSQDDPEGGEERIKGVGYSGRTQLRKRFDSSSNDLRAIFEHDTASDVKVSLPIELCNPKKPNPGTVTTTSTSDRHRLRAKLKSYLDKKSSVKRKKERNSSKSKNRYRQTSSTSSSDSVQWIEATESTIKTKERKGKKTQYREHFSGCQSEDKQRQNSRRQSRSIGSTRGNFSSSEEHHKSIKREHIVYDSPSDRKRSRYMH